MPENAAALDYLGQLKTLAADPKADSAPVRAKLDEAQAALDTDSALAASILRSGHVLLAAPGDAVDDAAPRSDNGSPSFALQVDASSAPAVDIRPPLPVFVHAARGVGYLSESDNASQQLPLLVQSDGHTVASLALLAAAAQQDVDASTIAVHTLGGVTLGSNLIGTDQHLQVLLRDSHGASGVPQYGFDEVISGSVQPERLAGKTVLVGLTTSAAAPVLREARLASSLLSSDLVSAPFWVWVVRALLTLLVGLYLMLLLPRLSDVIGMVVSAFLGVALLNGEYIPLLSQSLWLPLILPFLVLVFGHAGLVGLQFLRERSGVSRSAMSESNRELALAMQALNRFDQALIRFRLCEPSKLLAENLMALGQEHERGRRYSQALEVYYYLQQINPDHEGLADRLEHLRQLESTPTLTRTNAAGVLSRALSSGGLQKPMLGRYQVEKELGKGAMGVVYLGRDPKINRVVAIKTMALSQEFDADELTEVKERFFREAETAGRLNHPNIVTIYDAGEEHDLAYIAMEFLEGKALTSRTKGNALLRPRRCWRSSPSLLMPWITPIRRTWCTATSSPPTSCMTRRSARSRSPTSASPRITDSSQTKTGTILGSPLYMSPEQLSGKEAGRPQRPVFPGCYHVPVATGRTALRAPSLTGLMFKIANEPHPDVTFLRPDIPPTIKVVVDRALQKDPDARFQNGMEMANALRLSIGARKRAS